MFTEPITHTQLFQFYLAQWEQVLCKVNSTLFTVYSADVCPGFTVCSACWQVFLRQSMQEIKIKKPSKFTDTFTIVPQ